MHDSDSQFLSCLMDGEWQDLDPSRCAAEVCRDPRLQAKWARYHLIRDVLNNEPVRPSVDLATRVRKALAGEAVYSNVATFEPPSAKLPERPQDAASVAASPGAASEADAPSSVAPPAAAAVPARAGTRWRRGASGAALVASVAALTVLGLNLWQGTPGSDSDAAIAVAGGPVSGAANQTAGPAIGITAPAVEYIAHRETHWVTPRSERQPAIEARLNMFLSQHIEHSPTADRQGMLPYSRLVGYDEFSAER